MHFYKKMWVLRRQTKMHFLVRYSASHRWYGVVLCLRMMRHSPDGVRWSLLRVVRRRHAHGAQAAQRLSVRAHRAARLRRPQRHPSHRNAVRIAHYYHVTISQQSNITSSTQRCIHHNF